MLHGLEEDSMLIKRIEQHVPIYLQPFTSYSEILVENCNFFLPLAFNAPVRVALWDNRGKCYMDRKRIQCLSKASQHVYIYLRPFMSYSEILVGNRNFFLPLAFNIPVRSGPWDNRGKCHTVGKRIQCL